MAGGTRNRPRRGRGAAACVFTLAVLGAGAWSLGTTLDGTHPAPDSQVTRRPAALADHTVLTAHSGDLATVGHAPHSPPHTEGARRHPTRVDTVTGAPPRRTPTSGLPQTSGAAATLLLSALAILSLSAAYRVASAADRRERYHPRHRA